MKTPRKNTGFWAYLESIGRTDAEADELSSLRKTYRKEYERAHKQAHRRLNRHYSISFSRRDAQLIARAAREHGVKDDVLFLKQAVCAYLSSGFVVHHKETVDAVLQTLLRCHGAIQHIAESDKGSWLGGRRDYGAMESAVVEMMRTVESSLRHPPKLGDAIRKHLSENPSFGAELVKILTEHGFKVHIT